LHSDEATVESVNFSEGGIPKASKLMLRKPFVVSKTAVIKKYGTLNQDAFNRYQQLFCQYFHCGK